MYSGYLHESIITNERRGRSKEILQLLYRKNLTDISHVAVRGVSGIIMGTELTSMMGNNLLVVRKRNTKHSDFTVEFYGAVKNYIILDDLIDTGRTIKQIQKNIKQASRYQVESALNQAKLLAVVCYHEDWHCNPKNICGVPVFNA